MAPPSQRVLVDAYDDLRAAARLGDFGQGDAQFPREDLHDAGAAEARLAPAHAGPGAALDPVQAAGAGGAVDGVEDLALGDALAAADDLPVGGVLADELGPLGKGPGLGVEDALAGGVARGVVFQVADTGREAVLHEL